jgi:hypothetical protein
MPFLLRTRLESLKPEQITLTVAGFARVEVRGNAFGFVRCGHERRWVWGAFDETFRLARAQGDIWVSAWGLGGFARRTIRFVAALDLSIPRKPAIPRLRWLGYPSPRFASLSAQTISQYCSRADPRAVTDERT